MSLLLFIVFQLSLQYNFQRLIIQDELEAITKEIRCPECYVVFNSMNGLTRHRKIHFKQCDTLKCVLCPEHFKNSDSMNKHMQKCHPKSKRFVY